jgi:hypothetical protein
MQSKYLLAVSASRLPLLPSALAIPAIVVMSRRVSSNVVSFCCVMRQLREVQRRNSVKGHFGYNLLQATVCPYQYVTFLGVLYGKKSPKNALHGGHFCVSVLL